MARIKHDYAAAISLPAERFATEFTTFLRQHCNLDTEGPQGIPPSYVSQDKSGSMMRAILRGIPAHITWNVRDIDRHRSCFNVTFAFSKPVKLKVYIVSIVIGLLHSLVSLENTKSASQAIRFTHVGDADLLLFAVLIFIVAILLTLLFFIASSHYIYVRFMRNLLTDFAMMSPDVVTIARKKIPPFEQKEITDLKLFLFCVCMLVGWPAYEFLSDWSMPLQKYLFFMGTIPALLLLVVSLYALKRSLGSMKVVALVNNFIPALFAILLLFVFPALLDYMMRHVILYVFVAPRPMAVLFKLALSHAFICMVALVSLIASGSTVSPEFTGPEGAHQRRIEIVLRSNKQNSKERLTTSVSLPLRIIVWIIFLILSVTMWIGLLQNFSILVAFLFPDFPSIHFGWGKTIHDGITLLGNSLSPLKDIPSPKTSVQWLGG